MKFIDTTSQLQTNVRATTSVPEQAWDLATLALLADALNAAIGKAHFNPHGLAQLCCVLRRVAKGTRGTVDADALTEFLERHRGIGFDHSSLVRSKTGGSWMVAEAAKMDYYSDFHMTQSQKVKEALRTIGGVA